MPGTGETVSLSPSLRLSVSPRLCVFVSVAWVCLLTVEIMCSVQLLFSFDWGATAVAERLSKGDIDFDQERLKIQESSWLVNDVKVVMLIKMTKMISRWYLTPRFRRAGSAV